MKNLYMIKIQIRPKRTINEPGFITGRDYTGQPVAFPLSIGPIEAIDARDAANEALRRAPTNIVSVSVFRVLSESPELAWETEDEIKAAERELDQLPPPSAKTTVSPV